MTNDDGADNWTCPDCKRRTESANSRCDDCVNEFNRKEKTLHNHNPYGHKGRTPRKSPEGTKQRIITVRLPAALHSRLVDQRQAGGMSLNTFVVQAVQAALPVDKSTHN